MILSKYQGDLAKTNILIEILREENVILSSKLQEADSKSHDFCTKEMEFLGIPGEGPQRSKEIKG